MKRVLICIMICLICMTMLCACADADPLTEKDAQNRISIVATNFPPYDFARAITGDLAEIDLLLKAGMDSHSFEPTSADILAIQKCDVFIYVGGESDIWVEDVLSSMDLTGKTVIDLMRFIPAEEIQANDGDEHIWTSPKNVEDILYGLSGALSEAYPQYSEVFEQNRQNYAHEVSGLDEQLIKTLASAKRSKVIFGDKFPFRYLAYDYGLQYDAAYVSCEDSAEPSPAVIARLIDDVRAEQIPVVFCIEFSTEKIADTICDATGAKKLLMHSGHTVTQEELNEGITYVDLMQQNIFNLQEALN